MRCLWLILILAAPCLGGPYDVGKRAELALASLRPTRAAVDRAQVEQRREEIRRGEQSGPRKVVVGPDGAFYLVSGQHVAVALVEEGRTHLEAEIVGNYRGWGRRAFWKAMREKHGFNGRRRDLPPTLERLGALKAGDLTRVSLEKLLPTQMSVGRKEVDYRRAEVRGQKSALDAYLKAKRKKAVKGPGGRLYLIDGHHLAVALMLEGVKDIEIEIVADFSKYGEDRFWKEMAERKWVYLKDEHGVERDRGELPRRFSELRDDPYRSLAWMVEKEGGFRKLEVPFHEFYWADFFRAHVTFDPTREEEWVRARKEARELALSPAAAHLAGYRYFYCAWRALTGR